MATLQNGIIHIWEKLMKLGAGLMIIESTAVSKNGRISKNDLTLENKKNFTELKKLTRFLKKISSTKIGIQLSHSGRNGSKMIPLDQTLIFHSKKTVGKLLL